MRKFMKSKKAPAALLACTMLLGAVGALATGCGDKKNDVWIHDDIVNGGFEEGDFTGWKADGDYAFDGDGVVEAETVEGLDVTVTGKVGAYYFNGLAAANATSTGTLTSEPFKLGGTGQIGFKIGAGSDAEKCYVEFIEYGSDSVLKKVANEAYDEGFIEDELVRVVVDLSEHIGKNIYIRATDNGSTQRSHEYLHLDDFVMYQTEDEVKAAGAERDGLVRMYGRPVFENDTPTAKTVKNGNFEEGLNNWQILEGEAFSPKAIKASAEKFWDTREYNAEGNYFLDGFSAGEERTGAIRSTTFTLSETGIISFLMSSANHNTIYAAVCNEEAIGEIEAGTELFKVNAKEVFKDNELSENMIRRWIDASTYTADGKEVSLIGKKLYIKLVDNRDGGDFGAICFDDVRCSMTEEEVIALEKADYEWAMGLTGRGAEEIRYTQNYYSNYDYPVALPVIRLVRTADSVAVKAARTAVDLTAYLADVTASYGDVGENDFIYEIVSVEYQDTQASSGFDAFVFDTAGLAKVIYRAKYNDLAAEGSFYIDVTDENQVQNGGFETGNLAGWSVTQGEVNVNEAVSSAENGWTGASYNHAGSYHFDGVNSASENKTYAVRSSDFVLGGAGVISFKLGGRAATLRVYDAASGECLTEFKNTEWNDNENPHVEKGCRNLTMTTYFADLSQYLNKTLYIELADTETSDWGVAHFDDIVTYYEGETELVLSALIGNTDTVKYACEGEEKTTQLAWITAQGRTPSLPPQSEQPTQPEPVQPTETSEYEIKNGGFETGDLTGWSYSEGTGNGQISADAVCSDETFWDERIPFNKSGGYFFNGWNATEVEDNAYSLQSSVFKLGGSGYISFKMGGNAAVVKVFLKSGEQIGEYANTEFKNVEFPHVEKGCRLATMTTFTADLHEYIGQELYIELHDTGNNGWGVAFFDDVATYYESAPADGQYDDVTVYCENPAGDHYKMPWVKAVNRL